MTQQIQRYLPVSRRQQRAIDLAAKDVVSLIRLTGVPYNERAVRAEARSHARYIHLEAQYHPQFEDRVFHFWATTR